LPETIVGLLERAESIVYDEKRSGEIGGEMLEI
jgi:hypothetical protein